MLTETNVNDHPTAAAAYDAAVAKAAEALAVLTAKVAGMRTPARRVDWGHAGDAARLANSLVEKANSL